MGTEPERQLPGEPASASDPEDVELWVGVYEELATMLKRLVAADRTGRGDLTQRLISIEKRRQYWLDRRQQALKEPGQKQTG
jgi:hypothetical protein